MLKKKIYIVKSPLLKHLTYQFYSLQKLNADLEYGIYKCISDLL